MLEPLLASDARLNRRTAGGDTPLLIAATSGRTEVVRQLLARSPELNLQNNAGDTALIAASRGGYQNICRMLLAAGANKALRNGAGVSAADVASGRGFVPLAEEIAGKRLAGIGRRKRSVSVEGTGVDACHSLIDPDVHFAAVKERHAPRKLGRTAAAPEIMNAAALATKRRRIGDRKIHGTAGVVRAHPAVDCKRALRRHHRAVIADEGTRRAHGDVRIIERVRVVRRNRSMPASPPCHHCRSP